MKIAIHQPNFFPHKGFFDKIKKSDVFVFLDHVQYSKGSYTGRTIIDMNNKKYINLPLEFKSDTMVNQVRIHRAEYSLRKVQKTIKQNYPNSYKVINQVFNSDHNLISNFNVDCIKLLMNHMDIKTKTVKSSELLIESNAKKSMMLIEIINKLNGITYITGDSKYLEKKLFENENIELEFFNSMENNTGLSILTELC